MPHTPLSLLATIDHVLRDCAAFDLVVSEPATYALIHSISDDLTQARHLVLGEQGVVEDYWTELNPGCFGCAVAADAIEALAALLATGMARQVAYFAPLGFDPMPLARTIDQAVGDGALAARLASVGAIVDTRASVAELLEPLTLSERNIASDAPERSVGEALLAQLSYADLIIAHGGDGAGGELVEHLRAHDTLLTEDLHGGAVHPLVFGGEHDALAAFARVDPIAIQPWGGPSEHGTWTLDLHSPRPFHPARLLENIELLGTGELVHRGRFWVPSRPDAVCSWDGAGGQVSVGIAGMRGGHGQASTRLVVTGRGSERERLMRAFADSLLTEEELAREPESWLGEDALEPWLGAAS